MTLFMHFEVRNLEDTGQNPLLQNGLRSEPSWISPNHEWMHCIPSINELLISSVPEILSHLIVCLNRIQHIYIIYTILNIYTHLIPTVQSIKELRLSTNKHLILWLDTSMAHGTTVKLRWVQWQTNSLWKHDVKNPMFGKLVRSWIYHGLHGQKCLAFGGPISRPNAAPPIRPFNSWCK